MSRYPERDRHLTPDFVLGGLAALRNTDNRSEYVRAVQQLAICALLERLTGGQPFTFTVEEYVAAMKRSGGMGLSVDVGKPDEHGEHPIVVQHQHEQPENPIEQMLRQMGYAPEAEAQEGRA